jgi:hypothetical protein
MVAVQIGIHGAIAVYLVVLELKPGQGYAQIQFLEFMENLVLEIICK